MKTTKGEASPAAEMGAIRAREEERRRSATNFDTFSERAPYPFRDEATGAHFDDRGSRSSTSGPAERSQDFFRRW